jgi:hypothetical protein
MHEQQMQMFADAQEASRSIASGPWRGKRGVAEQLMRQMAERGYTIKQLSGPLMIGRSVETLKAIVRGAKISFSDYVPFDIRPVVEFEKTGDFYVYSGGHAQAIADTLNLVNQKGEVGIAAHAAGECKQALRAKFYRVRGLPNG